MAGSDAALCADADSSPGSKLLRDLRDLVAFRAPGLRDLDPTRGLRDRDLAGVWDRDLAKDLRDLDLSGELRDLALELDLLKACLDHDHSSYVDQWDWEKRITNEDRNLDYLIDTVKKIWKVIRGAGIMIKEKFPELNDHNYPDFPEELKFFHAEEILEMYPTLPRKQRETKQSQECLNLVILQLLSIIGQCSSHIPTEAHRRIPRHISIARNFIQWFYKASVIQI